MTKNSTHNNQTSSGDKIFDYWDEFYKKKSKRIPSQFAAFVASDLKTPHLILDFGCGNGRDSFFFVQNGHSSIGFDASKTAIKSNEGDAREKNLEHLEFRQFTVGEDDLETIFQSKVLEPFSGLPIVLYSRFFLHAIQEEHEHHFLSNIKQVASRFSKIYFEYRESRDEGLNKIYGDHYRRFINADNVAKNLCQEHAIKLDYQIIGQGFAKFGQEDPWIARQVFSISSL